MVLTEHVADVAVFGERPELVLPPCVMSVVVPGKFHHLWKQTKKKTKQRNVG